MAERDITMMYAAHDAFRRDLRLLVKAPDRDRWKRFSTQLDMHHRAEDKVLWPRLRSRGVNPELVRAMEAEHSKIDPLLERVSKAFTGGDEPPGPAIAALSDLLHAHLRHEESETLPLINQQEWALLDREMRRRIGLFGLRPYFAWLLEGVSPDRRKQIVSAIPAPLRRLVA
ncbi:hemerythrin domain-containing protein [Nocardia brasiliensis]|uniref:hemerythrin domain-containing protein n=1 Tax=Nocardia brasiliensis TaxID=37326 RepID=UPI002454FC0D|nr:hemerythrin domain-containing protein [Nocardia brasiliensis]